MTGHLASIFVIVLISTNALGESYTMSLPNKKLKIETTSISGVEVSATCFIKKGKTHPCEAYSALKKVVKAKNSDVPLAGHPAAFYCGSAGGLNRILKDSKNNEYDFCEFKDGSMINSWHLYKKAKR